jgi:two-component system, NtrC family, response regulator PilR
MKNRILIVEDEVAVANAFAEYLSNLGFQVDCTDNAKDALALADQTQYSVLLSDLRLPNGGVQAGLEFIKAMRRLHPETAVAVLSGAIGSDEMASVQKMGAKVVLRKPKPLSEIGQILMGLIEPMPVLAVEQHPRPTGSEIAKLTAKGATDAEIAQSYQVSDATVQEIRSDWFNAMPPRERMSICRELARKSELTH